MSKIYLFLFAAINFVLTGSIFAVEYVQSPPLKKVVKVSPRDCFKQKNIQLPFITWGGDIATVLANGKQKTTKQGSIFDQMGISVNLKREDIFSKQVEAYLKCDSPFLRGTIGMINMASEVTERDPRTKMKIFYQLTWSAGGDALVVKKGIRKPQDLRGKTIALQAYGPHVDYLGKILDDAGINFSEVKIKWLRDLTGTDNTPMGAFYKNDVDAAFVIIPDALALTSNGTVGTGAEDSVKGAKILMSTKTANKVIADVYAVRSDFYKKNKGLVENLAVALLQGQDQLKKLFRGKNSNKAEYTSLVKSSGKLLLDSENAIKDVEGMYLDADFVGIRGNKRFIHSGKYPRRLSVLNQEVQKSFKKMGLLGANNNLQGLKLSYKKSNLREEKVEVQRFNKQKVAQVIAKKQRQGTLKDGELFSFEVFFKPNQNTFSVDLYRNAFKKVIGLASTYGGALITVEGHSDPMGYLRKHKNGETHLVLSRIKQSAKNLSLTRANSVRDSLVKYATNKNVALDPSQFAIVGHGISSPKTGTCGSVPCVPKSKSEWLSNMRVSFRIIQVEAEESVFNPL